MFSLCSSFAAVFTSLHFKFYAGILGGNFPSFVVSCFVYSEIWILSYFYFFLLLFL